MSVLRERIANELELARKDLIIFTIATIVLTPFVVVASVLIIIAVAYMLGVGAMGRMGASFSTIAGALPIVFLAIGLFSRPRQAVTSQSTWFGAASAACAAVVGLTWATELPEMSPGLTVALYFAGLMTELAFLSQVYAPSEDNYYGISARRGAVLVDDPFTFRDDANRANMGLGFAILLPGMIMESYSHIFGSRWMWRSPTAGEVIAAERLLTALAEPQPGPALDETLRALGPEAATATFRMLEACEIIRVRHGAPRLSIKGSKMMGL